MAKTKNKKFTPAQAEAFKARMAKGKQAAAKPAASKKPKAAAKAAKKPVTNAQIAAVQKKAKKDAALETKALRDAVSAVGAVKKQVGKVEQKAQRAIDKNKQLDKDLKGLAEENAQLVEKLKEKKKMAKKPAAKKSPKKAEKEAAKAAKKKGGGGKKAAKKSAAMTPAPKAAPAKSAATKPANAKKGGKKKNTKTFNGHQYRKAETTTAAIWEELKKDAKSGKLEPTGKKLTTTSKTKPKYSNPMVTAGQLATGGVTMGLAIWLADWTDRFVATMAPGGKMTDPFYGQPAQVRILAKPGMMRYGVLGGTAVASGAVAYFTRKQKWTPVIFGAAATGFLAYMLLKVMNYEVMPRIFKTDAKEPKTFGARMYALEQVDVQDAAVKQIEKEDKSLNEKGTVEGLRGLFRGKVGAADAAAANLKGKTGGCGCAGGCGPSCGCLSCKEKYGKGAVAERPAIERPAVSAAPVIERPAAPAAAAPAAKAATAAPAAPAAGTLSGPPAVAHEPAAQESEPPVEFRQRPPVLEMEPEAA